MTQLTLSFLGPLQITLADEPVTAFRSDKERALLAFLALEADRPHRREALIGLLWPEQPETLALNNLRKTLHRLRQTLHDEETTPPFLLITPKTIQFNPNSAYRLDVAEFTTLLEACQQHHHRHLETCAACNERLQQAANLYRGDLLHGFFLVDCVAFDEWALVKREGLRWQALEALSSLTEFYIRRGEYGLAQRYAMSQIALEPWRESGRRQLMQALALRGDRSGALAQYAACRRVLAEELGVEPEAETKELYEWIISGSWPTQAPASNLQPLTTPFIGRERELARLREGLLDPAQRLVTLVGEGGIGKTWLALKAAEGLVNDFMDGAWFVALAGLVGAGLEIPETIAAALGFTFYGQNDPKTQLLNYLHPKESLLVLDNFEQVMAGAGLIIEILDAAPKVVMLVTSREPLKFQAEQVIRLEGLPVPPSMDETEAERYSSVQLFIERAERATGEFALTVENRPSVIEICQLLGGLPLGLVLAASQLYSFSAHSVAQAIRENVDALAVSMRDLPPRQRSIRAVFEWSWSLLTSQEQAILAGLSVFRGGFSGAAAQVVADATSPALQSLADKSLIRQSESGRYDMHELWRQIASEKLGERERGQTLTHHSQFFMTYAGAQLPRLNGLQPRIALLEMQVEIDNLREAWRWAVTNKSSEALIAGLGGLTDFYDLSSLILEGMREIETAIEAIVPATLTSADQSLGWLSAKLWTELARFRNLHYAAEITIEAAQQGVRWAQTAQAPEVETQARLYWGIGLWRLGDFTAAQAQIDTALALATQCHNADLEAEAYRALGRVADHQGRYNEARAFQSRALQLFQQLNDIQGECHVSASLGNIAWSQGDLIGAIEYFQQSLRLAEQTGNRFDTCDALHNLGNTWHSLGDYETAQNYFQQSLEVGREVGLPEYVLGLTVRELALVKYHLGDNHTAQRESLQALAYARAAGLRREEGLALTCLGHVLAGLKQYHEAVSFYRDALKLQRELGQPNLAVEPLAGLARLALTQGERSLAGQYVEEILKHLETGNLEGADEPFQVYLTCYRVLQVQQDPRAAGLLQMAHELLQNRAATIEDERLRRLFLENVPAHRELVSKFKLGATD